MTPFSGIFPLFKRAKEMLKGTEWLPRRHAGDNPSAMHVQPARSGAYVHRVRIPAHYEHSKTRPWVMTLGRVFGPPK